MAKVTKRPPIDYELDVTLSAREARYIRIVLGSVCGRDFDTNLFDAIAEATGSPPVDCYDAVFFYGDLPVEVKKWVMTGV